MPLCVRDADNRVVEGRQDVGNATDDILGAFGLDDLLSGEIVGQQLGRGGSRRSSDRPSFFGAGFFLVSSAMGECEVLIVDQG